MKALTVDDDPIALSLSETILRYSGFDVLTAPNAVEASQIIAAASPPFDCLLLDFIMPKIEGDYLCQWVRQLPQYAHTPILMVTAAGSKSHIDRAFAAGSSDYITKPYSIADLEIRLSRLREELLNRREDSELVAYTCSDEWESKAERVNFCKPMLIGEISKELKIAALEQYIRQIARSGQRDICAVAFALENAAKLHFNCTKSDFLLILREMARAISVNLPRSGSFMAYVGCGSFAGVVRRDDIDEDKWRGIEQEVRQALSHLLVPGRSGDYLRVVPHACAPLLLGTHSPDRSLDVLYRAVIEAEERTHRGRRAA